MTNLIHTAQPRLLVLACLLASTVSASLGIAACQSTAPVTTLTPNAAPIGHVPAGEQASPTRDATATAAAAIIEAALTRPTATLALPMLSLEPPTLDFAILDAPIVDGRVSLRGAGRPNVNVLIVVNGQIVGRTQVHPDGHWSTEIMLDKPGKYSLSVQAVDSAGQQSTLSMPIQLSVVTTVTPLVLTDTLTPILTATQMPDLTATATARADQMATAIAATLAAQPSSTPTTIATPTYTPVSVLEKPELKLVLPICNCEDVATAQQDIIIRLRYGAKTRELAEKGADVMSYSVTMDERAIPFIAIKRFRKPATLVLKSYRGQDAWWVYWDYPVGKLSQGAHFIVADVWATQNGSDGWASFEAESLKTFSANLQVR